MITKKQLLEKYENLEKKFEVLQNVVVTEELKHLRERDKLFKEQTELLKCVRLKVKCTKIIEDSHSGEPTVTVTYQLPTVNIPLDENGNVAEKIPFFYAINALGLVDSEDYEKITAALAEAKKSIDYKKNQK